MDGWRDMERLGVRQMIFVGILLAVLGTLTFLVGDPPVEERLVPVENEVLPPGDLPLRKAYAIEGLGLTHWLAGGGVAAGIVLTLVGTAARYRER